ncbi:uncharacterized protein LOC101238326 isoform X2 [Hydra vulgaris]|uniref:Uncharacterized protein LOC101238326 isoform X2 n=1 Tax=Hydra vulgaris TaxID=6087 RepID=A0ABM4DFB9_HYDVU
MCDSGCIYLVCGCFMASLVLCLLCALYAALCKSKKIDSSWPPPQKNAVLPAIVLQNNVLKDDRSINDIYYEGSVHSVDSSISNHSQFNNRVIKPFTLDQTRHMSYNLDDRYYNPTNFLDISQRSKSYPNEKLATKMFLSDLYQKQASSNWLSNVNLNGDENNAKRLTNDKNNLEENYSNRLRSNQSENLTCFRLGLKSATNVRNQSPRNLEFLNISNLAKTTVIEESEDYIEESISGSANNEKAENVKS